MPTYCYTTTDGETVERYFPISRPRPHAIRLANGRVARRDLVAERMGAARCTRGNLWPMYSDSLGCHPSQIPESMEYARRHGVPTEFDKSTGQAVLTSKRHRARYANLYDIKDRNAGYSDPQ